MSNFLSPVWLVKYLVKIAAVKSAALCVGMAVAWRASSYRVVLLPEDFVLADSGLSDLIPEVLVSSVADQWLLYEFCSFQLLFSHKA